MKLEFGQRCKITKYLNRKRVYVGNDEHKEWKEYICNATGIYLGTRTLKNGRNEFDEYAGTVFYPESYFEAALVCTGPRSKPIFVPLDAVEQIHEV